MSTQRIHPWAPSVVTGLMAISAAALFFRTASSRQMAAQTRRAEQAQAAAAVPVAALRDAGTGTPANPLRQAANPAARRSIMAKRLDGVRGAANSLDQTRALLALIREFEPGDFALAMDECKAGDQAASRGETETILEEWSRRDPAAALAYAGQDADMKASILGIWAETHAEEALNWVHQHGSDGDGDELAGAVIAGMANTNPKLAIEHLSELSPEAREKTLTSILKAGDAASTRAVIDWIGAIKDPAEQAAKVKMAYEKWGTYANLDQKYGLFEAYPEALSGQWIQHLFGDWIDIDPPAALAAIDRLPEGDLRREALGNVMRSFVTAGDLKGATALTEKYGGEVSDEMIAESFSDGLGDPNVTLQQAALIGDAGVRASAVASVLNQWADTDPKAAREWMDRNDVAGEVREKFDKLAKRGHFRGSDISKAKIAEAVGH